MHTHITQHKQYYIAGTIFLFLYGMYVYTTPQKIENTSQQIHTTKSSNNTIAITVADTPLNVIPVKTPSELIKGLGGRTSLAKATGMLFYMPTDTIQTFWMKDMHFAIDIIWIHENTIIGIEHNVPNEPLDTPDKDLKLYTSSEKANMVLETNAGWANKHNITIGDTISVVPEN